MCVPGAHRRWIGSLRTEPACECWVLSQGPLESNKCCNHRANSHLASNTVTPPQRRSVTIPSLLLCFAYSQTTGSNLPFAVGQWVVLCFCRKECKAGLELSGTALLHYPPIYWSLPGAVSSSYLGALLSNKMFFLSGASSHQTCYILSLMSLCPQSAHQITMLNLVPFLLLRNVGGVTNVYEVCSSLELQRSWDTL